MRPKAVVLLSGGIDSATVLYLARTSHACHALIFDYGQRHKREILSAVKLAEKAHIKYTLLKISLPWKGSALLDGLMRIPSVREPKAPATYVPARNIIFMAYALSCAEAIGARAIFIGAHSEDYSGYPDCRKEYFDAFSKMKDAGTEKGRNIKVVVPLLRMTKKDIIRLGLKLKVPFALTWSCYSGGAKPCLKCDSCFYRTKGFKELGKKDPALR